MYSPLYRLIAAVAFGLAVVVASPSLHAADAAGNSPAEAAEFFEKQVRPVLVNRCQKCHSGEDPKGSLSLESRSALLTGGDSGAAIEPGKPDESLLVDAINYGGYKMPPKGKLPDEEIAVLTRWVEMGAPWPAESKAASSKRGFDLQQRKAEHWAWRPIQRLAVPTVKNGNWPSNPIDQFVLVRLEEHDIQPAPPADRRTLARRLYFDLIGVPPTREELNQFLADESPQAVELLVDRLLASPHFGERWARHWLDLVRYAETRGHEFDHQIPGAFEYRDYVIRALNADVPYDQFVTEHVAGDLLEQPRLHREQGYNESILGTGFWFFGEGVHSPVDLKQDEADRVDNMIDTFGKAFQGMTIGCARCHDHKFDAISTKDYYALFGYLRSSGYRRTEFETSEHNRKIAAELSELDEQRRVAVHQALAKALRSAVEKAGTRLAEDSAAREAVQTIAGLPDWQDSLKSWLAANDGESILDAAAIGNSEFLQDGFTFGNRPARPGDVVGPASDLAQFRLIDFPGAAKDSTWDVLRYAAGTENDPCRPGSWPRAGKTFRTRTFTINTGKLYYLARGRGYAHVPLQFHWMNDGPLHAALIKQFDTGEQFAWVEHNLSAYPGHVGHIEFTSIQGAPLAVQQVVQAKTSPPIAFIEEEPSLGADEVRDRLLVAIEHLAPNSESEFSSSDARFINWMLEQRAMLGLSDEDLRPIAEFLTSFAARRAEVTARIKSESRLAPVVWDLSGADEQVMVRGSSKNRGELAPRRFLEAVSADQPATEFGSGRLDLAWQLLRDDNPFTARVMVNRIWHHLFGRGIVPTVDNFGVLGQSPTHPELLDWLADEFRHEGWSIKRTIWQIVLSRTYQMSSRGEMAANEADPENLLWHRQQVRRLEGEAIRDTVLVVSGRLDRKLFGPSVEVHLTPFMTGRGMPSSGPLDGAGRRSIYQKVRRNFLSPMMLAFDTPMPIGTIGRRSVSNVPAQALILMNDPFVVEQSRLWAERSLRDSSLSVAARVNLLYEEAIGRQATEIELKAAEAFLHAQAAQHGKPAEAANYDSAVWADLCHVLLNTKEFIFIQ